MAELTMLAEMMDRDLERAAPQLAELNMTRLDLKTGVFDRPIENLDDERRERLARLLDATGTSVYCFSSTLGHRNISDLGEIAFRTEMETGIANMIATAQVVRPDKVRLLSCWFDQEEDQGEPNRYLAAHAPWVYDAYRDAMDQIEAAGLSATIENEPNTVLASPESTVTFFDRLERPDATFTWDIQNMWQSGTYPRMEAYRTLRPLLDYVHLKGGRSSDGNEAPLAFRCPLEQATWPVREIVEAVLSDGASPVICLNPSHGAAPGGYEFGSVADRAGMMRAEALRDVAFLRATFGAIS